jgi:hypothetical protein
VFLIFGFRTKVYPMGWAPTACHVCGGSGSVALFREVTKLSLFFVPLIPIRTKYVAECSNPMCRSRHTVSKREARSLAAH